MEKYELYLLLHILSAMIWFGGSVLMTIFGIRVARDRSQERSLAFARDADAAGKLFAISGISTALWGILLVADVGVGDWEETWVVIGIIGILWGAVVGMAYFTPQTKKLISQLESGDVVGGGATASRIAMVARVEIVVLLVVTWAMVVQPGG